MASVKELKRGKYIAHIYIGRDENDKQINTTRRINANGIIEARKIADDLEDKLRDEFKNAGSDPLFSKFYDTWYKNYAMKELDVGTRQKYSYIDMPVLEYFGNKKLKEVTALNVIEFFDYETENKRASLEAKHRLLSSIYRQAVKWQLLEVSPMDNVSIPKVRKEATSDYFRPDEIGLVLELMDTPYMKWQRIAFKIALIGGLRRGEILGIVEDSVDYERSGVMVKYSLQHTKKEGTILKKPKTENARFVTLPEFLMNEIKSQFTRNKYMKIQIANLYEGFKDYNNKDVFMLFQNEYGRPYLPNTLTQAWRKFNDKNKQLIRIVRFHDLRHSSVTYLLNQGFNMKEIQVRLGHTDIRTTLNRYSHVSETDQINAAKAFDKFKSQ